MSVSLPVPFATFALLTEVLYIEFLLLEFLLREVVLLGGKKVCLMGRVQIGQLPVGAVDS